jgi:hypothetical protein
MFELDARAFYAASNALMRLETAAFGKESVEKERDGSATITFLGDDSLLSSISETVDSREGS